MIKQYWEDYNTKEKTTAIYEFLKSRTSAVWIVLGKDRQRYYKDLWYQIRHTTKDFEQLRTDLFGEYLDTLARSNFKRKIDKLFFVLNFLGTKEDWEKFNRKEYIV